MGIVTVSAGVASLEIARGTNIQARELIEIADEGLYIAKDQGRYQIVFRDFRCRRDSDSGLNTARKSAKTY